VKTNRTGIIFILFLIVGSLVGSLAWQPASAATASSPVTLRFSTFANANQIYSKAVVYWADLITKRTEGRIKFEYAWGGALFRAGEEHNAVKNGLVESCAMCQAYNPAKMPLWNVTFTIPFGPSKVETLEKACWRLYESPELVKDAEQNNNVKLIFPLIVDRYEILSKRPLKNLNDMKGKKIAGIGVNLPILGAAGMVPVSIPVAERYGALQTGVVDAQLLGVVFSDALKLQEVAKNLIIIDYGAMIICQNVINRDVWNRFSPQDQKIILDAGKEAAIWQSKETESAVGTIIEKWKNKGVTVTTFSSSDRAIWAERIREIPWKWGKDRDAQGLAGTEAVKAYFRACEGAGYKFPYDTSQPK
jgi:TRAP-type transport system periplasmic protein